MLWPEYLVNLQGLCDLAGFVIFKGNKNLFPTGKLYRVVFFYQHYIPNGISINFP